MKRLLPAPGFLAVVCFLAACNSSQQAEKRADSAHLKEVISDLKDGKLIEEMNDLTLEGTSENVSEATSGDDSASSTNGQSSNKATDEAKADAKAEAKGDSVVAENEGASADPAPVVPPSVAGTVSGDVSTGPATAPVAVNPTDAPAAIVSTKIPDPCPQVAKPPAGSADDVMLAALKDLAKCFMDAYHPAEVLSNMISHLTVMKVTLPAGEQKLSDRTIEELDEFGKNLLKQRDSYRSQLGDGFKFRDELRTSFSDEELKEIVALARRRTTRLREVEKKVFAAMDERMDLIKHFGTGPNKIDRYAALLALRNTAGDPLGARTVRALMTAFNASKTPIASPLELMAPPAVLGLGLIHPYALTAILPDPDHETNPLHPELENPFERVKHAIGELAGPPALVDNAIYDYGLKRDMPLFKQPAHPPAAADAVRVAFVDTGVDYVAKKDLGLFLGDGTNGQLSSEDFGGTRGKNAWGPVGIPSFNHGSFTMATLLTLVANMAPEILQQRKLDLAMWKMRSDTILLTGPVGRVSAFTPQIAMKNDFMAKIENNEVKPKIVSISMSMGMWPYMEAANKKDLVKDAPWLWVMSSGNEGRSLDTPWTQESGNDVLCLEDIPQAHRDDSKILCVGALVQGIINPEIAEYSNYGKRVDVYAFESYTKLCPNGTSCAAPAVTAAATILANRYPSLTPAQLKQVIVETAEERELEVGLSDASSSAAKRSTRLGTKMKVKVFNPIGMMDKALQRAAEIAGVKPAK